MKPNYKYNNSQKNMLLGIKNIEAKKASAYEAYMKNRAELGVSGEPLSEERFKEIAPIFKEELNILNTQYGNVTTFRGLGEAKPKPKYASSDDNMIKTYNNLINNTNFFNQIISPKKQSGLQLIDKVISFDTNFTRIKGVSSISNLVDSGTAINNIITGKDPDGFFAAFDMETLSGKNKYGYDDLLGVTEYTFNIYGEKSEIAASISNVAGIDSKRYKELEARLKSLQGKSNADWSELDKVVIDRLNFYNHSNIENVPGQARRVITGSKALEDITSTVEGAISGLQKLGELTPEHLAVVQSDFENIASGMKKNGKVNVDGKTYNIRATTGHNTKHFDVPKFNRASNIFGANAYIDETTTANFDLFQSIKYIYAKNGGNHYGVKGMEAPEGKGLMTLEYLKAMYPDADLSSLASHTAFEDVNTSARMLLANIKTKDGSNVSLLEDILGKLNELNSGPKSTFVGNGNQLFRVDQATSFSDFNRSGGLGFVYDPFSKTFKTFNGYTIKDGNVSKSPIGQTGFKAGALYNLNLQSFETGEEFTKSFGQAFGENADQVMSEYNVGRIYHLTGVPVFDTSVSHSIGAKQSVHIVTNNLNDIESMINNMNEMGVLVDKGADIHDINNYVAKKGINENPDLKLSTVIGNAKNAVATASDQELLMEYGKLSTNRLTNEHAANYVRELDFDKHKKIKKVLNSITETYKGEIQETDSISKKIAYAVSKGNTLGGFDNIGGVFDPLSFFSPVSNRKELLTNSVNNLAWSGENIESLMPIFDEISNMINDQLSGNGEELKLKRNEAFKAAVKNVLETLSPNNLINTANDISGYESEPTKLTNAALDYIELTNSQLFGSVGDDDLNKIVIGEKSLPTNILGKLYGKSSHKSNKEGINKAQGLQELLNFTKRLNNDPEYKGVFDNLDKSQSPKEMSADIMQRLNSFVASKRKDNPIFGIVNTDINTHLANKSSSKAAGIISGGLQSIRDITQQTINDTRNYVVLNRNADIGQSSVDKLVARMIQVSRDDIKNLNLDDASRRTIEANYNLAKSDIENVAKDILSSIKEGNLELSFNEKSNEFGEVFISKNGQNTRRKILPVLRMKNNTLYFDTGTTNHVVRSALDTKSLANGKLGFVSQTGSSIKENRVNFTRSVTNAMDKGLDELESFDSAFSKLIESVREGSPAISLFNPQAFTMQLYSKVEDITGYMDMFSTNNGKSNGLPGYNELSKDEKAIIDKFFNKIKQNENSRDKLKWGKITPSERSIFQNNIMSKIIGKNNAVNPNSNSDDNWLLSNLMFRGKSTALVEGGVVSVGSPSADFLTSFDKQSRDNPTQFPNMFYHSKAEISNRALNDKHLKGKISELPLITDSRKQAIVYNVKNKANEEFTGMVTGKYAVMDTNEFKRIVVKAGDIVGDNNPFVQQAKIILGKTKKYDEYSQDVQDQINEVADSIKDRTLYGSTYNQETIIDSRFADTIFNKRQIQVIGTNKTLIANSAREIEDIERLQFKYRNGKFEYGKGFETGKGGFLFAEEGYADSRNVRGSKTRGIVKGAFFDEYGNIIKEQDVQKFISKDITDYKDVEAYLKESKGLDFKYYIDPFEAQDGVKISLSRTEKSVSYGLQSPIGAYNPEIRNRLKGTRFEEYIGRYSTDTLLDTMEGELPGIKESILLEKNAVRDVLFGNILKDTGVVAITNQNVSKHEGVGVALTSAIGRLKEAGKLNDENIGRIIPGAVIKDGSVYLSENDNFRDKYISMKALEDILGSTNVYDSKEIYGEQVNIGYGEFAQTIDWRGGSSKGLDNYEEYNMQLKDMRSRLAGLDKERSIALSEGKDISELDKSIANLRQDIQTAVDERAISSKFEKGFVYSDRMHDLLGAKVLNDDFIKNLDEKNDPVIMKAMASFVDENGVLKDEYRGQQLLSPLTNLYKNNIFEKEGARSLKSVSTSPKNYDKRFGHIKDYYTRPDGSIALGDNISAEWAEKAYSVETAREALYFNEQVQAGKYIDPEGYGEKLGYKIKRIEDFAPQSGNMLESLSLDPDSAYFSNSIFDMGEEFGDKRYLAVPRPAYRVTGGSITEPNSMKMLKTLKHQHQAWLDDKTDINKDKISKTLEDISKEQSLDFGNMQQDMIKERLGRSYNAKAAGVTIYRGTAEEAYDSLDYDGKLALLKKYNGTKALTEATFEGKNYLEHYASGRYLDTVLVGRQAFEEMGYFTEDALNAYGGTREQVEELLKTKGDVALLGRFPMIQEGSAIPSWAILDDSLVGNEVRVIGSSQPSLNMDFDGDNAQLHALMNKDKKTYSQYLEDGIESDEVHNRIRLYMLSRSVSQNRYYEEETQKQLMDEAGFADIDNIEKYSGDFMNIARKSITDGERIFANVSTLNQEEISTAYHAMNALKAQENLSTDKDLLSYINNNDLGDEAKVQYAMYKAHNAMILERAAKTQKSVIGEANTINFKARKIFSTFVDKNIEDYNERREMFNDTVNIFEEKVISSKSADEINLLKSQQWKQAINNIIAGNNVGESKKIIEDLFDENIAEEVIGRYAKYAQSYPTFRGSGVTEEDFAKRVKTSFLDTLDLIKGNKQVQKYMKTTVHFGEDKFGQTTSIFDAMELLDTDTTIQGAALKRLNSASILKNTAEEATRVLSYKKKSSVLSDNREWLQDSPSTGDIARKALKSTGEAFDKIVKGFDGKTLAMGALGLAGAILVSGFVGGNPSRPTQNQAEEDAQEQYYDIPSLVEQNAQSLQGKQQGYVVNINARTNKGKQHAVDTINQSISRSYNTNVNIAMNITDQNGNINDRYVEQLLAGVIGN